LATLFWLLALEEAVKESGGVGVPGTGSIRWFPHKAGANGVLSTGVCHVACGRRRDCNHLAAHAYEMTRSLSIPRACKFFYFMLVSK